MKFLAAQDKKKVKKLKKDKKADLGGKSQAKHCMRNKSVQSSWP
jgi:hypothetical protein